MREIDMVRAAVMVAQLWEGERPAPAAAVKLVAYVLRDCEAENATYRAALEKIARGVPGCDAEYIARKAIGSPSGSEGDGP